MQEEKLGRERIRRETEERQETNRKEDKERLEQPVAYRGGIGSFKPPPTPEIPKALQNRAKLNPIVKTVKNC